MNLNKLCACCLLTASTLLFSCAKNKDVDPNATVKTFHIQGASNLFITKGSPIKDTLRTYAVYFDITNKPSYSTVLATISDGRTLERGNARTFHNFPISDYVMMEFDYLFYVQSVGKERISNNFPATAYFVNKTTGKAAELPTQFQYAHSALQEDNHGNVYYISNGRLVAAPLHNPSTAYALTAYAEGFITDFCVSFNGQIVYQANGFYYYKQNKDASSQLIQFPQDIEEDDITFYSKNAFKFFSGENGKMYCIIACKQDRYAPTYPLEDWFEVNGGNAENTWTRARTKELTSLTTDNRSGYFMLNKRMFASRNLNGQSILVNYASPQEYSYRQAEGISTSVLRHLGEARLCRFIDNNGKYSLYTLNTQGQQGIVYENIEVNIEGFELHTLVNFSFEGVQVIGKYSGRWYLAFIDATNTASLMGELLGEFITAENIQ